jgi:hypothetical protein
MRRTVLLLASVALVMLLASGVALAIAPGAVLGAHTADTTEFIGSTGSGPPSRTVQTFTAQHTGLLTDAQARLARPQGTTGDINAQIVTIPTADNPSRVLAETTIPATSVPEGFPNSTLATFSFGEGVAVTAGQSYGLALSASFLGLEWRMADDTSAPNQDAYPDGKWMVAWSDNFSDWVDATDGKLDGIFAIYVVPGTTQPADRAECKNGGYKNFGLKNQGLCTAFVNRAANNQ